jgi:hypothetical protein
LTWQEQPAALLAWALIVAVMLGCALGIDRTFIIDQANYVNNFSWDPSLDWTHDLFPQGLSLKSLVIAVFSEEALWHVWTTSLGSLLEPTTAVLVTVCVLNLLIALSVVRLADPVLPLLLWLLMPVGFAIIGLSVLRQGFALAVMLYIALRLNRPVLATLVAAMIHTTFAIALPFAFIGAVCGRRRWLAVVLAVGLAFAAAYIGGTLFGALGGRRLKTYSVNEAEATSALYVIGALVCSLPSVLRLTRAAPSGEPAALNRTLANLAVMHVGIIAFVVTSFFVFPLGTGRVGYLSILLLIPMLPTLRRRDNWIGMLAFCLVVLYLIYLAVKAYLDGAYDIYL